MRGRPSGHRDHCDRVVVAGRVPKTTPGSYTVRFTFTVVNHHGTRRAANVRRSGRWLWLGAGAPSRQCGGTDAPTVC